MNLDHVVKAITDLTKKKGYPPTVRELAHRLNRVESVTHGYLRQLIEQGRIAHLPGSPRTLRVKT